MRLHTLGPYWASRTPPTPSVSYYPPVKLLFNGSVEPASSDSGDTLHYVDIFNYNSATMTNLKTLSGKQSDARYINQSFGFEYDEVSRSVFGTGWLRKNDAFDYTAERYRISRVDVDTGELIWSVQPYVLNPNALANMEDGEITVFGVTESVVWVHMLEISYNPTYAEATTVMGFSKVDGSVLYVYHEPGSLAGPSPTGNMSSRNISSQIQALNDTTFILGSYTNTPTPGTKGINVVTMTGGNTWTAQDVLYPMPNTAYGDPVYLFDESGWSDRRGRFYLSFSAICSIPAPIVYVLDLNTLTFVPVVTADGVTETEIYTRSLSFDEDRTHLYVTTVTYDEVRFSNAFPKCTRYTVSGTTYTPLNSFGVIVGTRGSGYVRCPEAMYYCNNHIIGLSEDQGIAVWSLEPSADGSPQFITDQWYQYSPNAGLPYKIFTPQVRFQDRFSSPGNNTNFGLVGYTTAPTTSTTPVVPTVARQVYIGSNPSLVLPQRLTWFSFEFNSATSVRMTLEQGVKGYVFDASGRLVMNTNDITPYLELQLHRWINKPGIYYLAIIDLRDVEAGNTRSWMDEATAASDGFSITTSTLPPIAPATTNLTITPYSTSR